MSNSLYRMNDWLAYIRNKSIPMATRDLFRDAGYCAKAKVVMDAVQKAAAWRQTHADEFELDSATKEWLAHFGNDFDETCDTQCLEMSREVFYKCGHDDDKTMGVDEGKLAATAFATAMAWDFWHRIHAYTPSPVEDTIDGYESTDVTRTGCRDAFFLHCFNVFFGYDTRSWSTVSTIIIDDCVKNKPASATLNDFLDTGGDGRLFNVIGWHDGHGEVLFNSWFTHHSPAYPTASLPSTFPTAARNLVADAGDCPKALAVVKGALKAKAWRDAHPAETSPSFDDETIEWLVQNVPRVSVESLQGFVAILASDVDEKDLLSNKLLEDTLLLSSFKKASISTLGDGGIDEEDEEQLQAQSFLYALAQENSFTGYYPVEDAMCNDNYNFDTACFEGVDFPFVRPAFCSSTFAVHVVNVLFGTERRRWREALASLIKAFVAHKPEEVTFDKVKELARCDLWNSIGWNKALHAECIRKCFEGDADAFVSLLTPKAPVAPRAVPTDPDTAARPSGGVGLYVVVNAKGRCRVLTKNDLTKSKICGCVHRIGGSEVQCTLTDARRKSISKLHGGASGRCRHHHTKFRVEVEA